MGCRILLGYGFSVYDLKLNALLDEAQKARTRRNPKIIEKLNSFYYKIKE